GHFTSMAGNALDSLDHHGLQRCIFFEWPPRAGRYIADLIDHVHALNDLAEDRVAPTCLVGVESLVVIQIHVELSVAAVRILAPRHAHGAALIGQAVARLIDHLGGGGLESVTAVESAALNDEVRNDT